MIHVQVENWKNCVSYVPYSHKKHTVLIFSMCVVTMHSLHSSDIPVTLKDKVINTWYKLPDSKQG